MTDKRYKVWDSELMEMEPGEVLSAEDGRNMSVMVKVGAAQEHLRAVLVSLTHAIDHLAGAVGALAEESKADASRIEARLEQLEADANGRAPPGRPIQIRPRPGKMVGAL